MLLGRGKLVAVLVASGNASRLARLESHAASTVVAMSEVLTYEKDDALYREKALEGRLCLIVERAGDIIWTVDLAMRPTYISPTIQHHLGYTAEEALALKMEDVFSQCSYDLAMKVFAEEMAREQQQGEVLRGEQQKSEDAQGDNASLKF